ncbi:MAG: 30S ribosomal protein S7 [Candidatus Hydrogenedentota bacterium]
MPRRREITRRQPLPDPKYKSVTLARFVNSVMVCGKKSTAENIVYRAIAILTQKLPKEQPLRVFETAINNSKPLLQVKSRRVGGATYQVPVEVPPHTQTAIAFRWIIDYARKRGEKTMEERLAAELLDCYNKTGNTIKKREDTHRMAEANKAFAHLRY